MSVLVYTESWEGKFKKSTFEVVSYAKKVADNLSADLCAIACGNISDEEAKLLGKYGATKVLLSDEIKKGDNQSLSALIASNSSNYDVIVFSNTNTGKINGCIRLTDEYKPDFHKLTHQLDNFVFHWATKRNLNL